MKNTKDYLFIAVRELATVKWALTGLKASRGVEKLYNGKREGFRYALIGDYWSGEAVGAITRSGESHVID